MEEGKENGHVKNSVQKEIKISRESRKKKKNVSKIEIFFCFE